MERRRMDEHFGVNMQKKRFHIQKAVWWNWIISYIAIMIIPLLFGVAIYVYAMQTIKDEVQTIQQQAIVQVKYNLETMEDDLYRVSYALSSSAYNIGIYAERSNIGGYTPLNVVQLQKTMSSYRVANNNISSIYMYFPDNDYILSNVLTYRYEKLGDDSEKFLGLSKEQFATIQNMDFDKHLLVINPESANPQIYYVYNGREFNNKITVFMPLNMDALKEMMQIENTGVYWLINKQEIWLGGTQSEIPERFFDISDGQEIYTKKSGPVWWMVMPFAEKDNFLATCILSDDYYQKVDGMQWILIAYLVVSFGVGGIAAWLFSRHHYVPVERLLQTVDSEFQNGKSEYEIITDYLTTMKEQHQVSRRKLKESKEDIHNSQLAKILHSSNEKLPKKLLEKFEGGKVFEQGEYMIAGVLISNDEYGRSEANIERDQLDIFIVDNIINEVLANKYTLISGQVDGFLVYLIHFHQGSNQTNMETVRQNLEYAIYYIDQFYHIDLTINLSRVSGDIGKIGKSFEEIKEIQEYRDWDAKDGIKIRMASSMYFPEQDDMESIQHYHKYTEMLQYMKKGDYEKVDEMLQSLINKESSEKESAATPKDRMVAEMVDYIDHHYDDWQLSGKMFAERYQVSLSYLSQVFKKEKGIGLLDYINRVRYTKAKAMIDEGVTIQEAAKRAGYSTTQPLRRLFRQFEGVTPSQSRKKKDND